MSQTSPSSHDHHRCIQDALHAAEEVCAREGSRLTQLRRRVLELVWQEHDAVKAYDLLANLGGEDGPAQPPTVYRALQFLLEMGLVHRLESLNAYVGCPNPRQAHAGMFLICTGCGVVQEVHESRVIQAVASAARQADFRVTQQCIEARGLCGPCAA